MDTQNTNDAILERRYNSFLVSMLDLGGCTFSHLTLDMVTAKRQVISQTISIFCAVLLFQGCNGVLAHQCSLIGWFPTVEVPIFLSQRTTFGISLDDIREGFWGRDTLGPLSVPISLYWWPYWMAWAHSGCGCWQIGSKIPKCFFSEIASWGNWSNSKTSWDMSKWGSTMIH